MCAVSSDGDYLITEGVYMVDVGVGDFGTHRYFGSGFEGGFKLFREDRSEVCRGSVCPEAHGLDDLGIS